MRGYWDFPGGRESFGHHMGGVGIAGMVLMIILWVAVIAAIVLGIRALILHSRRSKTVPTAAAVAPPLGSYPPAVATGPAPAAPSLLAILEERYARGEIGRETFLQQRQDLGLTGPATPPAPAPETTTPPEVTN